MEESTDIRKEIFRKYNKDPLNWRVFAEVDRSFYQDLVIVHEREAWFLKEMAINPEKTIGLGVREKLGSTIPKSSLSTFGFREVRPTDFNPRANLDEFLTKILARQPKPLPMVFGRENFILQGPVSFGRPKEIDDIYNRIQQDLKRGLDNLVMKKYPHLKTIYG
jgi:hypothetical protein